jgi:hypothetical protein
MKQTKAIVITAIVTLLTLGTVLYTSCRKDHCKTLKCLHGGACNDGFCLCPTGYTGTYCEQGNTASIDFKNRTFTRVYLTLDNVDYTVDSGKTLTITKTYGDSIKGTAYTQGLYGIKVTMAPINVGFPTSATRVQNLDISADYFFLKVFNNNPTLPNIAQVHVNYLQRDQTLDIVQIPNNGFVYNVGYYRYYSDTHIRLEKTPVYIDFNSLSISDTASNKVFSAVWP